MPIIFQLLCATEYDIGGYKNKRCVVVLTGRRACGAGVLAICESFRPSLRTRASDADEVFKILDGLPDTACAPEEAYEFRGYRPDREHFDRHSFTSNMQFMSARKRLRDAGIVVYDAALPASMQMMLRAQVSPCGWVSVSGSSAPGSGLEAKGTFVLRADWTDVVACTDPVVTASTAPFTMMAFDIECASSHGEFPCARKRYERVARELAALPGATLANARDIAAILRGAYDGSRIDGVADIGSIYTAGGVVPSVDTLATIAASISDIVTREGASGRDERMSAFASMFANHHRPRPAASIAEASSDDEANDDEAGTLVAVKRGPTHRYDAILHILNSAGLPRIEGDPIIQIGAVHRQIASKDDTSDTRHIFVLGDCDTIPGVYVHTYDDERSLIVAFFDHVKLASPDFVSGYNIDGFDAAYIETRIDELSIEHSTLDASAYMYDDIQRALGVTRRDWQDDRHRLFGKSGKSERQDTTLNIRGRVVFDLMHVVQKGHSLPSYKLDSVAHHFTGDKKDDVTPAQIFASHAGTPADRALVASYCVQDCALVLHLASKLNVVMNSIGMADVCGCLVSWIFSRGQGAKTIALVSRQCAQDGYAIPSMTRADAKVDYEGATVLTPKVGAYIDDPITVLDFASLYPSSMISSNISHDTLVLDEEDADVDAQGACDDTGNPAGSDQIGDTLEFVLTQNRVCETTGRVLACERSGRTRARFVNTNVRRGILPRILERLLAERKRVRTMIKTEPDAFRRSTLDGLQLAYKITANSLYGQLGAPTSPIFLPDLAAATTAVGRRMLNALKIFAEDECGAEVVYGDTDSCFMRFPVTGETIRDRIACAITAGKACSDAFRAHIPAPHNAEFEKVLCPFLLLSKKRYTGNLYEDVDSEPRQASMGIVLKRRDNAPIVKTIYGGVIERVMRRDVAAAAEFARVQTLRLARGQVDTDELIVSKMLRAPSAYVDPAKIAHVVLAKRMNDREAGSSPTVGERIPFVYVVASKGTLQGDRIEHPDYVGEQRKRIDYGHYLTNQVRKPLLQLMSVLIDKMPGSRLTRVDGDPKQISREVDRLIFDRALSTAPAVRQGLQDISKFFGTKPARSVHAKSPSAPTPPPPSSS
jgi:DNA polymerase elongation subunit (family B)